MNHNKSNRGGGWRKENRPETAKRTTLFQSTRPARGATSKPRRPYCLGVSVSGQIQRIASVLAFTRTDERALFCEVG